VTRCPTCNQPMPDTNAGKRADPPLPPLPDGYDVLEEVRREQAKPRRFCARTGW
jgi:hypothetical protein